MSILNLLKSEENNKWKSAATLYSRIYLNFNDNRRLHIPEIIDKLDENDFHCYYFPYIENEEKLKTALKFLEISMVSIFPNFKE